MGVPTLLDHIVIAGPDLDGLVDWFADRTGVTASAGGRHPTGTANALVAFTVDGRRGPHYLELIGPDPEAAAPPTVFGIADLDAPRIAGYAIHPDDISAVAARAREAGYDPGEVRDLSRRTPDGTLLEWRIAHRDDGRAGVPFLIEWGDTPHPGLADLPTIELLSFERADTDAAGLGAALDTFALPAGALAHVVAGDVSEFRLAFRTTDGRRVDI